VIAVACSHSAAVSSLPLSRVSAVAAVPDVAFAKHVSLWLGQHKGVIAEGAGAHVQVAVGPAEAAGLASCVCVYVCMCVCVYVCMNV
jgi:hypothetical protein